MSRRGTAGDNRGPFAGLMTAEAISLFGSQMTFVALPWLVLVTTGSATRTGWWRSPRWRRTCSRAP